MIHMSSHLTFANAHQLFIHANETDGVLTRYSEPWRYYHDETHISEGVRQFSMINGGFRCVSNFAPTKIRRMI